MSWWYSSLAVRVPLDTTVATPNFVMCRGVVGVAGVAASQGPPSVSADKYSQPAYSRHG